jgi:hypothetical protein
LTTFIRTTVRGDPSFSSIPLRHSYLLFRFTEAKSVRTKKFGGKPAIEISLFSGVSLGFQPSDEDHETFSFVMGSRYRLISIVLPVQLRKKANDWEFSEDCQIYFGVSPLQVTAIVIV